MFANAAAVASTVGAEVIVSVFDQELALVDHGKMIARYPVLTLKFGIGDSVRPDFGTFGAAPRDPRGSSALI